MESERRNEITGNWQATDDGMNTRHLPVSDPHTPTHTLLTRLLSMISGHQCDGKTFGKGRGSKEDRTDMLL